MGFWDKLFHANKDVAVDTPAEPGILKAPFSGTVVPLEQFPDAVFSQGILGKGCGIQPEEEQLCAPCDGVISQLTPTKHAIGLTSNCGMEVLIHVGVDTVDMNGAGFDCHVEEGQKVKAGQLLLTFSKEQIAKANHPCITAMIVTNADDYSDVQLLAQGAVAKGDAVLTALK